jgi:uncharacterized membrane-anchored protein YhcB (DUF1043 family)
MKLLFKGKELQENTQLGNITLDNEINMVMIAVTMRDDLEDSDFSKKLIDSLSKFCDIHKTEKAASMCLICSHSVCSLCEKDHTQHKVINKSELLKNEYYLKEMNDALNYKLKDLGMEEINGSINLSFKPQELNKYCEELIAKVDLIKKRVTKIMNSFKLKFDSVFPMVLDFKDKINELISQLSDNNRERLLKNDKEFIDFYNKYEKMNMLNTKTNENMDSMQNKIDRYKYISNEFKSRTESILEVINDHYTKMKDYHMTEEANDFVLTDNINSNNIFVDSPSPNKTPSPQRYFSPRRGHNSNMISGKINLFNLHNSPGKIDRNELLKNFDAVKRVGNDIKATSKFVSQSIVKIEPLNLESNLQIPTKSELQKKIINIQISTRNIYIYDSVQKSIDVKELELPHPYKKFEAYHSILNYNNQFFLSGSFSSSRIIFQYDLENNTFNRLPDMPSGHSYHTLIGAKGNIYVVSGFKTKKVEQFNLESNAWISLPEVNNNRSWPSCMNNADKELYICGGLNDPNIKAINVIEKINLSNPIAWEVIEINSSTDIPFNFGIINTLEDNIIMVGGNFIKNEESIDNCFILNLIDKNITIADFKIPHNDNFDGKAFIQLDQEGNTFGQFSTESYEKFYIYDKEFKVFELKEYK